MAALIPPANSQDQSGLVRHCLSIVDVNERVDCLETGAKSNIEAATVANPNTNRQQSPDPSFDCRAARSSIERAICTDPTLSDWDGRMGRLFQQALHSAKNRQPLLDSQRAWIVQRDSRCGALADNVIWTCLLEMTKLRATALATTETTTEAASADSTPSVRVSQGTITQPTQSAHEPDSNAPVNPSSRAAPPQPSAINGSSTEPSQDSGHAPAIFLAVLALAVVATASLFLNTRRNQRIARENQLAAEENERLANIQRLVAKYGQNAAARILASEVWQGMTWDQLVESRGRPSDVGREIIKEKTRETWKYHQIGRNRFRERIYLENGIVIGWKN
jgi:uncharacterized protein YecT (DUF1311 family)